MTTRDRTVIMLVALVVVLGGVWLEVVSPERKKASNLNAQIATAQAQLSTAEKQLGEARGAQSRYAAAYESIVNLGKAVPPTQEVPSLIYQVAQASDSKRVNFSAIASGSTGGASTTSASASSAAGAAASAFTQLPFTLTFNGGFFELEHLLRQLADFTTMSGPGNIDVSGRLLTVQSVKLALASGDGFSNSNELTGTITADAYVLPAGQGLTAGASPSAPGAASATPASSSSAGAPTTPAVVKASTP